MVIEMNDVFKQCDTAGIVEDECGARIAILPPDGSQPVVLDEVAAAIWQQLDTVNSIEDISQTFSELYDHDLDLIRTHVYGFVQQLAELKIAIKT